MATFTSSCFCSVGAVHLLAISLFPFILVEKSKHQKTGHKIDGKLDRAIALQKLTRGKKSVFKLNSSRLSTALYNLYAGEKFHRVLCQINGN